METRYEVLKDFSCNTKEEAVQEKLLLQIKDYVYSLGGNDEDIRQIVEEIKINKYTTMEQVKSHIYNYYL